MDQASERIDRLEEGLAVIKGLFAPGPFSYEGKHYRISGLDGLPKPVQQPGPPVLIGGGGPRVLALAGREADIVGINPAVRSGRVDADASRDGMAQVTDRKLAWVRDAAGERYPDIELNMLMFVVNISDDRDATLAAMAPFFQTTPEELGEYPHTWFGSPSRSRTTSSPGVSAGTCRTWWSRGSTSCAARRRSWPGSRAREAGVTSLAFAGAGWITAIHGLAADAVPDLRVVHVASRRGLSASRRAEQTGAVVCRYDDLPGGADAVLVATPPAQHRREAERAVEGGALALVETPLAATLVDADALVALAARGASPTRRTWCTPPRWPRR